MLAKRAELYSFGGNICTASQVAELIDSTFCVRYHRDHKIRLLREAGWSRQQPIKQATQRNEEAIKQFSEQRWPARKKAEEDKAIIVWVDQAGFYLLPMAVRTWVPRAQTPVLRGKLTRDQLSAISGTQ